MLIQAVQTLNETGKLAEIKFSSEEEQQRRRRSTGEDVSVSFSCRISSEYKTGPR